MEGGAPPSGANGGGDAYAGDSGVKLYVGNLSYDSTEDSLRHAFGKYGTVVDCYVATDRDSGKPRGTAAAHSCRKVDSGFVGA